MAQRSRIDRDAAFVRSLYPPCYERLIDSVVHSQADVAEGVDITASGKTKRSETAMMRRREKMELKGERALARQERHREREGRRQEKARARDLKAEERAAKLEEKVCARRFANDSLKLSHVISVEKRVAIVQ